MSGIYLPKFLANSHEIESKNLLRRVNIREHDQFDRHNFFEMVRRRHEATKKIRQRGIYVPRDAHGSVRKYLHFTFVKLTKVSTT